jgi:hypothetical protein
LAPQPALHSTLKRAALLVRQAFHLQISAMQNAA